MQASSYKVTVEGVDISPKLAPIVQRISIRDEAGAISDTAEIELDDRDYPIALPRTGVSIEVALNDPRGFGVVFRGAVDEVRSAGDRGGGRTLTISAKGINVLSDLKQARQRHWDDTTIGEALTSAGSEAGVAVSVDPALAAIQRPYLAMRGESFLAFGQRLAREVGGTFKVADGRAVLAKRNGGTAVSGAALETVKARWGENLISWELSPVMGRRRHRRTRVRTYDPKTATWKSQTAEVEEDQTEAVHTDRFPAADDAEAGAQAGANAAEVERGKGGGSIAIDANASARPEAVCELIGARPGIDGLYRITAVEHAYDRGGGVTTRLEVGQPHGAAGKDKRTKAPGRVISF